MSHVAASGGRHEIGPEHGELLLHTSRQGLAAQAGHDLTIAMDAWSGVVAGDDPSSSSLEVTVELGSLRVVSGSGGVKPLSDRDKRQIAKTAHGLLDSDSQPEARFVSQRVTVNDAGGVLHGEFTLRGTTRPVDVTVEDLGGGRYRATATIVQSEFGIKPYTALLGALKLADEVEVSAEVTLPTAG